MSDVHFLKHPFSLRDFEEFLHRTGLFATISREELVAVKLHMGEPMNLYYLKPALVRAVVGQIREIGGKPFLTDTTTLYRRGRFDAIDHLRTAELNGFFACGAPVIIADSLRGEHGISCEGWEIAQAIWEADWLVVLTHCTGHISFGYGGAIKNVGMGCLTKNGKRRIHRHSVPRFEGRLCEACGSCTRACSYNLVRLDEAGVSVDENFCVGCGRCVSACPTGALRRGDYKAYVRALVSAAKAVLSRFEGKVIFLNFLIDVMRDCDCAPQLEKLLEEDLGVLASHDIVAIEKASYDLITERVSRDVFSELIEEDATLQLRVAESLGLGESRYSLVDTI